MLACLYTLSLDQSGSTTASSHWIFPVYRTQRHSAYLAPSRHSLLPRRSYFQIPGEKEVKRAFSTSVNYRRVNRLSSIPGMLFINHWTLGRSLWNMSVTVGRVNKLDKFSNSYWIAFLGTCLRDCYSSEWKRLKCSQPLTSTGETLVLLLFLFTACWL